MRGGLGDLQTSALLLCLNDKDENRQISLQMDNPSFVFHLSFVYQTNPRQRGVLQYLCLRIDVDVCTKPEKDDTPKTKSITRVRKTPPRTLVRNGPLAVLAVRASGMNCPMAYVCQLTHACMHTTHVAL